MPELILLIIVAIAGMVIAKISKSSKTTNGNFKLENDNLTQWETQFSDFPFRHYWNGYGIAIDPQGERIFLQSFHFGSSIQKIYSFDDLREWRYQIAKGGKVSYGPVIGSVTANIALDIRAKRENAEITKNNELESGFFVTVKDINMPEWQIRFPNTPTLDFELKRWMEIFRQYVNENKKISSIKCLNCSTHNEYSAKFCSKCGRDLSRNG